MGMAVPPGVYIRFPDVGSVAESVMVSTWPPVTFSTMSTLPSVGEARPWMVAALAPFHLMIETAELSVHPAVADVMSPVVVRVESAGSSRTSGERTPPV